MSKEVIIIPADPEKVREDEERQDRIRQERWDNIRDLARQFVAKENPELERLITLYLTASPETQAEVISMLEGD